MSGCAGRLLTLAAVPEASTLLMVGGIFPVAVFWINKRIGFCKLEL
jgi:hypothetical protein